MSTELIIELVAYIGIPAVLLMVGLFAGRFTEGRHLRKLTVKEADLRDMLASDVKRFPPAADPTRGAVLVVTEVIIATDYLKHLLARLRNLVGGEETSYGSLMMRARREAVCRLLEQARGLGYNAVCNIRMEFADVGGSSSQNGTAMAAILASGTAYLAVSE